MSAALEVEIGSPAQRETIKEGTADQKTFYKVGVIIHGAGLFGLPLGVVMSCDAAFDVPVGAKGSMPLGEIFVTDERNALAIKPYLRADRSWFASKSGLAAKAAAA
jgi:hypothetical protein